jgi:hypothetical protein
MVLGLAGFLTMVLILASDLPGGWKDPPGAPGAALAERKRADRDDDRNRGASRRAVQSPGARAGGLTRGPYLQTVTPDAITIRWRTGAPERSVVRYGTSAEDLALAAAGASETTDHEVRLTGLRPDTRYYYTVGDGASVLAGGADCTFHTAPPVGVERKVRIWAIGDSGQPGPGQQRVQVAYDAHAGGADTDVWLLLGDNAYSTGTGAQYQAGFFDPYRKRLRSTVVWPSRGNHDAIRKGPGNDYYDFFTLPQSGEAGGTPSGTEAWYSFDYANVHFICLDAERLAGGAMIDWLRSDLAATDQDWVIAYWHHPPYSKGSHDSDSEPAMVQARRQLLPVLEEGGVDLVLCGHSHAYERSYLLDGHYGPSSSLERSMVLDRGDGRPDGDGPYRKATYGRPAPHEGTVYAVVGSSSQAGGGPLKHRVHATSLHALGSLVIEISGRRLDASFVDERLRVADRFAITKGDGITARGAQASLARPGQTMERGGGQ